MNDLRLEKVSVQFQLSQQVVHAVDSVDLFCQEGRITGLIGESGSGKSVLGMSILGLLPATAIISGRIYYGDQEILSLSENEKRKIRGEEISFIPQSPDKAFDPLRAVGKQIAEPLLVQGMKSQVARSRVEERLEALGFENPAAIAKSYSFELSGGMCQRALCALGTIRGPKWLIADEPTKGLDAILRKQVVKIFRELRAEGKSILLITHDLQLAEYLCDDLVVMKEGKIVEQGVSREVFKKPHMEYTRKLLAARPSQLIRRR